MVFPVETEEGDLTEDVVKTWESGGRMDGPFESSLLRLRANVFSYAYKDNSQPKS